MTNDRIARICHEVNRGLCEALEDLSQVYWEDAPHWQRASALQGVEKALDGSEPADSHASWCRQKFSEGWTYGTVKNPKEKTHPCLVPFEDLPAEQQLKDHLFVTVVRVLGGVPEKSAEVDVKFHIDDDTVLSPLRNSNPNNPIKLRIPEDE